MKIVNITELAQHLSYWIKVAQEKTVIVVRHGHPVVKIVPYKEEEDEQAPISRP